MPARPSKPVKPGRTGPPKQASPITRPAQGAVPARPNQASLNLVVLARPNRPARLRASPKTPYKQPTTEAALILWLALAGVRGLRGNHRSEPSLSSFPLDQVFPIPVKSVLHFSQIVAAVLFPNYFYKFSLLLA